MIPRPCVCFFLLLTGLANLASGQEPTGRGPKYGHVLRTDAVWPGIFLRVSHCERLPDNRLMLKIQVVNPKGAPRAVLIRGAGPATVLRKDDDGGAPETLEDPYSLDQAVLRDTATGREIPVAARKPGDPYPGESAVVVRLRPDEAVELGAFYSLPAAGAAPLILTLSLPQTRSPIGGIPVPVLSGVNAIGKGFRVRSEREMNEAADPRKPENSGRKPKP